MCVSTGFPPTAHGRAAKTGAEAARLTRQKEIDANALRLMLQNDCHRVLAADRKQADGAYRLPINKSTLQHCATELASRLVLYDTPLGQSLGQSNTTPDIWSKQSTSKLFTLR